jgi:HAD superfamily hydrolase (TIGR01549 family)
MSANSNMLTDLDAVLTSVDALLLDFDGPICTLFANYSPCVTGADARMALSAQGIGLPDELRETQGALALLKWAESHAPSAVPAIEEIQELAEERAVGNATPTPYSFTSIVAAHACGLKLAIVSNNSPKVIARYLGMHGMSGYFTVISGRDKGDASAMKPCPALLMRAASALRIPIGRCAMVGDAMTDIAAAKRAGARSVGYAGDDASASALAGAGADAVIKSMAMLASALQNLAQTP